jgi:hypothetical protein
LYQQLIDLIFLVKSLQNGEKMLCEMEVKYIVQINITYKVKVKLSRYMPWGRMGGEEV